MNNESKRIELNHGQQIRVDGFRYSQEITVGTVEGYARKSGWNVEENVERAKSNKHQLAYTIQAPAVLMGNYPGKSEEMRKADERFANATLIKDGDRVRIEGRNYRVRVMGEQYCDPVHFVEEVWQDKLEARVDDLAKEFLKEKLDELLEEFADRTMTDLMSEFPECEDEYEMGEYISSGLYGLLV